MKEKEAKKNDEGNETTAPAKQKINVLREEARNNYILYAVNRSHLKTV